MAQIPLYYGPDLDQAWSRNAGVCRYMTQFLPTMRGSYATVSTGGNYFGSSTLNSMPLIGYLFRQVSGTERMLLFNTTSIDEYNNAASRTSRGTGYNASTTGWSAAAFGNNIIACNYLDATQVSSGAGFGNLGGSPPKARHVTVQSNFVMFADTDDGTNQYADQVWWSGQGNSASYTPDLATQAGNIRLVDSPGPIRCLVNFRNYVVAFKDDATYLGQYVGPPFIWSWRLASNRIGCGAQHGAAEYGGVLYFVHSSGIYSFDGSQFVNIGRPLMRTLLKNCGVVTDTTLPQIVASNAVAGNITQTQVVTDDIEGTVLFAPMCMSAGNAKRSVQYGYNVQTRRWGCIQTLNSASQGTTGDQCVFIKCTSADMQTFLSTNPVRYLYVSQISSSVTCNLILYPASTFRNTAEIMTGVIGGTDMSTRSTRMQLRFSKESRAGGLDTPATMTVQPYSSEGTASANAGTAVTGAWNAALRAVDFNNASRFCTMDIGWVSSAGDNDFEIVGVDLSQGTRP